MKLEVTPKTPDFKVFASYLGLLLGVVAIIGILIAVFNEDIKPSNLAILILLPFAVAGGLTYSSRTFILKISEVPAMEQLNAYILEFLVSEDLMNVQEDASGISMHSTRSWNQLFNHWFGTEKVRIVRTPLFMLVSGHRRYIDGLESKLLYGRKK